MITDAEITPGLVLHLDPDTLAAQGATCTCTVGQRVQGGHFFLCLEVEGELAVWVPLYSNDGVGRSQLSANGRSGHRKWTTGTFYWYHGQVWRAPHPAVVAAADAGGDMSRAGSRNKLAQASLPKLTNDANSQDNASGKV